MSKHRELLDSNFLVSGSEKKGEGKYEAQGREKRERKKWAVSKGRKTVALANACPNIVSSGMEVMPLLLTSNMATWLW